MRRFWAFDPTVKIRYCGIVQQNGRNHRNHWKNGPKIASRRWILQKNLRIEKYDWHSIRSKVRFLTFFQFVAKKLPFKNSRFQATAVNFLITKDNFSGFHLLKQQTEIWYHHKVFKNFHCRFLDFNILYLLTGTVRRVLIFNSMLLMN